jgi:sugar/nucleoside kinase (ribokinase family)
MGVDLAVATPVFLDLTFVGLEALPAAGEERFAGDLVRSPGGGAITAVAATRLGLRTALVAPIGTDAAGNWIRGQLEAEGVVIAGWECPRTSQTVVMPVGEENAMVTVDPGARARAADIASLAPRGVAANLDQLDLVPDSARVYLTIGDDDARAFAGRPPAALAGTRALFVNRPEALVVTAASSVDDAAERLGSDVETVVVMVDSRTCVAVSGGRRVDVPSFDTGRTVDTTGYRDLMCAAYAWADLRDADHETALAWSVLYAELAATVPTATGGALSEARLLEEGDRHGLTPPARAVSRSAE